MRQLLILLLRISWASGQANSVKIKFLALRVASTGFGEWRFAALLELDGKRIVFDTRGTSGYGLAYYTECNWTYPKSQMSFLSHNHLDHTAGLMTLRKEEMVKNKAVSEYQRRGRDQFDDRNPES